MVAGLKLCRPPRRFPRVVKTGKNPHCISFAHGRQTENSDSVCYAKRDLNKTPATSNQTAVIIRDTRMSGITGVPSFVLLYEAMQKRK